MDSIVEFAKSFPGKPKNRFSLKWNDFRENLSDGFSDLLEEKTMVDVTLAADGKYLQAHKLVLSVCSPYFKNLFQVNPCKHPIVILNDVGHNELSYMLQFMYRGEVGVKKDDLPSFLKLAHTLKVKGLTGNKIQTDNLNLSSTLKSTVTKIRKKRKRDVKASPNHRASTDLETGNKMKETKKPRKISVSENSISSDSESESSEIYKGEPLEKITCDKSQCEEISRACESVNICERSFNEVDSSKDLNCDFKIKNGCDASDDNIDDEGVENIGLGDADGFDLSTGQTDLRDPTDTDQTPQGHVSSLIITRAPRAFVWDYFLKETHQAICLNCGKTFKGQRPNTICEQHLRRMHPEFYKILLEKKIKRAELHMNPPIMGMGIPSYDHD